MATEEFQSPQNPKNGGVNRESIISPRFRSVAAMAGWDEEAILLASTTVDDTPEKESSSKSHKRIFLQLKSPQTNSRRKRRIQKSSPVTNPVSVLNLGDDDDVEAIRAEPIAGKEPQIESLKEKMNQESKSDKVPPSAANLPCMDKLREELSCAICLEICFEPSTTPCGHSFCKKCLKSAADKCGKKCPKCRQLIGNGRSCIVNTSLWNTIQLLFPQEVEARKAVAGREQVTTYKSVVRLQDSSSRTRSGRTNSSIMVLTNQSSTRGRSGRSDFVGMMNRGDSLRVMSSSSSATARIRRAATPSQAEDAALALRLQREEFMVAFRATDEPPQPQVPAEAPLQVSTVRANLRAMASRAIDIRLRRRLT